MKTTRLIGTMCKWSDPFSKSVLIDRGLDHNSLETLKSQRKNVSSDYSVLKARPSKKEKLTLVRVWPVSMTVRNHLSPFRTQKLSSLVPKIVRWKRRVKIGSRRLKKTLQKKFWGVFVLSWNRFRRKQKGRYALKMMWALKMKQTGREGHNFM